MGKATAIIQARMGSTRLPGKIFMPLPMGGQTSVLQQVCRRVSTAAGVEQFIIATTTNPKDDMVEKWAGANNCLSHRGSEGDVLDRFYRTAEKYGADPVIRITADCPCIDGEIISEMLAAYRKSGADYLSNTIERTFPHGLDTEIFSFAALKRAREEASLPSYREHVTPYIYKSGLFNCRSYVNKEATPGEENIRVTLDTREDYTLLSAVYDLLGETFSHKELVSLFKTHGWLGMINENIVQKKVYGSTEEELADALNLLENRGMTVAAAALGQYLKTM